MRAPTLTDSLPTWSRTTNARSDAFPPGVSVENWGNNCPWIHRPPPLSLYFSRRKPSSTLKRNKPLHFLLRRHHATAYNTFVLYRSAFVFLAAFLWMAAPLLACLPNSSMTPAEMDCCKRMAGNCDMGGSNHKCCGTTAIIPLLPLQSCRVPHFTYFSRYSSARRSSTCLSPTRLSRLRQSAFLHQLRRPAFQQF